jgi:hypothetical protein
LILRATGKRKTQTVRGAAGRIDRPDNLRERLLADLCRDRLRPTLFPEIRQEKKVRARRFSLKLNTGPTLHMNPSVYLLSSINLQRIFAAMLEVRPLMIGEELHDARPQPRRRV